MGERLESVYKTAGRAGSYSSAGQLYREARRRGLAVTRRAVEDFVASYKSASLFRRRRRKPLATFAATLHQKWQLDLGFYPPYKGTTAFLVCIDVLSRKCWMRLLKGKTSSAVARAFESIVEEGDSPSYVITDRGTEFAGAPFQDILSQQSIHHYYANPPYKASIAERVIGTLKAAEGRLAAAFPGRNWPERLEKAVRAYNDTVHSATGRAPNNVTVDDANAIFRRLFKPWAQLWKPEQILQLGTAVRLVLHNRGAFTKSNVPRNSAEVFTVGRIRLHPRAGVKYKLFTVPGKLPIAGTYTASEIVPVKLPQL